MRNSNSIYRLRYHIFLVIILITDELPREYYTTISAFINNVQHAPAEDHLLDQIEFFYRFTEK